MFFRFHPLRFVFRAREPIYFPEGNSANILRGAFGSIFRRIACAPDCQSAAACALRATCPYAKVFEPSATDSPSGLRDLPRPFVFRAWHLDGRTIPATGQFHFDLNLFELQGRAITYLVLAFAQLGREGLGPDRKRVDLTEVWQLDLHGQPAVRLFNGAALSGVTPAPAAILLTPESGQITQVRLKFITPTELKAGDGLVARPEFSVLAARIRDRLSTLSQAYGDGPLPIDFKAFGERTGLVRMIDCRTHHIDIERRSSRSGRVHPIGGFVGEAVYQGDLGEFLPYLKAAKWTGVGRQTVWGKGEVGVFTL